MVDIIEEYLAEVERTPTPIYKLTQSVSRFKRDGTEYVIPAGSYVSGKTGNVIKKPFNKKGELKEKLYTYEGEITGIDYLKGKLVKIRETRRDAASKATIARNKLYTDSLAAVKLYDINFAPEDVRVGNALDSRLRSLNRNYLIASNKDPRSAVAKQYMADAYANELAAAYAKAKDYLPKASTVNIPNYLRKKPTTKAVARQAKFARWYGLNPANLEAPIQEVPIQEVAGSLYGRRRRMY